MGDEYLNGRPAEDFEQAAIAHARQCERERVVPLPGRGTDILSLPVLS